MNLSRIEALGEDWKKVLKVAVSKHIMIIGTGGVGSPLANLLVRSGFKNLILVDNDFVDESNLQRQLFSKKDVGVAKCEALKNNLLEIEDGLNIECYFGVLGKENINSICSSSDLIIDCTDNFETRKVINEYCEENSKDWLHTGAIRNEVVCCMFYSSDKLFSKVFSSSIKDEACHEVGVLGSTTFVAASVAYNEILKYFMGIKENRLVKVNLWDGKIHEVKLK